jgi:hypothetical protein
MRSANPRLAGAWLNVGGSHNRIENLKNIPEKQIQILRSEL